MVHWTGHKKWMSYLVFFTPKVHFFHLLMKRIFNTNVLKKEKRGVSTKWMKLLPLATLPSLTAGGKAEYLR